MASHPDSTTDFDVLREVIRNRRAVFPQTYNNEPISRSEIMEVLDSARWAPTHKKTEPWRFIVFHESGLDVLANWLTEQYRKYTLKAGDYSETKEEKIRGKVMKSGCVIAICMHPDPAERVPEWEEVAAVACAVQNMWLSCSASGIGSYWSTPQYLIDGKGLPLADEDWISLGLFYMGKWDRKELPAERSEVNAYTKWAD